jgi:RIO kinase 2
MVLRGSISALGSQIGVGKESGILPSCFINRTKILVRSLLANCNLLDIYLVINEDQEQMVIKFQRLGRVSFRTIKRNRDYLQHRKSASWLYFSRLAAVKEYTYMKVTNYCTFV